jgi:hypothetical protein
VYFRLLRDTTAERGYEQRSLVLLVRKPYVSLYKVRRRLVVVRVGEHVVDAICVNDRAQAMLPLVAGAYFDRQSCATSVVALETAWQHMLRWPAPQLGFSYELPLFGCELSVHLPHGSGLVSHILDAPPRRVAASPFDDCTTRVSNLHSVNVFTAFSRFVASAITLDVRLRSPPARAISIALQNTCGCCGNWWYDWFVKRFVCAHSDIIIVVVVVIVVGCR